LKNKKGLFTSVGEYFCFDYILASRENTILRVFLFTNNKQLYKTYKKKNINFKKLKPMHFYQPLHGGKE